MTTYSLDLSTLRELLGNMPVLLSTPLPQGIPLHPYPSYGYIRLRDGKIDSCWIEGKNGFHLQGSLAEYPLQDKEQSNSRTSSEGGMTGASPVMFP